MAVDEVCGTIVFESKPTGDFSNAVIYVRLEDTSVADAPSETVAETELKQLSTELIENGEIPFTLKVQQKLEPRKRYTVSVHVDILGRGHDRINRGDYINTQSYPVLTLGYPTCVDILVHRV